MLGKRSLMVEGDSNQCLNQVALIAIFRMENLGLIKLRAKSLVSQLAKIICASTKLAVLIIPKDCQGR